MFQTQSGFGHLIRQFTVNVQLFALFEQASTKFTEPKESEQMKLTAWLLVIDGTKNFAANGELYKRIIDTQFVPHPGVDEMALWKTENDNIGLLWFVKHRFMDADGEWNVELVNIVIDPNDHWQDLIKNRTASGSSVMRERSWYTNQDGDLMPKLINGGWVKY